MSLAKLSLTIYNPTDDDVSAITAHIGDQVSEQSLLLPVVRVERTFDVVDDDVVIDLVVTRRAI